MVRVATSTEDCQDCSSIGTESVRLTELVRTDESGVRVAVYGSGLGAVPHPTIPQTFQVPSASQGLYS